MLMLRYACLAKLIGRGASEEKTQSLGWHWPANSTQRKNHPWPRDASPTLANCRKFVLSAKGED